MATLVAFVGLLSVLAMVVGAIAAIKGNILSLGIKTRKAGLIVVAVSFILFVSMLSIDVGEPPGVKTDIVKEPMSQETGGKLAQPEPVEPRPETASILEQDYIDFVSESSMEIGKALGDVGRLCQSMSFTDDWMLETAVNVGIIQHYCSQVLEKQPPEKFKEVHDLYVKACSFYTLAMDSLTTGIDNFDAAEIEKAAGHMTRGTEYINMTSEKILSLEN